MPGILIDSNVLLDIFTEDRGWFGWSSEALATAAQTSLTIINPIIYAEISVRFTRADELDDLLSRSVITREPISYEAAFLAGKAHMAYRRLKGTKHVPLPDFFIGAHAAVAGHSVLTRDPARYRSYFPNVRLIAPERT